jgi:hypothetical protein
MSFARVLALLCFGLAPLAATADTYPSGYSDTDLPTALAKAAENGKPILVYLSRAG